MMTHEEFMLKETRELAENFVKAHYNDCNNLTPKLLEKAKKSNPIWNYFEFREIQKKTAPELVEMLVSDLLAFENAFNNMSDKKQVYKVNNYYGMFALLISNYYKDYYKYTGLHQLENTPLLDITYDELEWFYEEYLDFAYRFERRPEKNPSFTFISEPNQKGVDIEFLVYDYYDNEVVFDLEEYQKHDSIYFNKWSFDD